MPFHIHNVLYYYCSNYHLVIFNQPYANLIIFCPLNIRRMAPVFEKLSQNHTSITFVKIDTDNFSAFASEYEINSIPTFFFLSGDKTVSKVRLFFPISRYSK